MNKKQIIFFTTFALAMILSFIFEIINGLVLEKEWLVKFEKIGWKFILEEIFEIILMLISMFTLVYLFKENQKRRLHIKNLTKSLSTTEAYLNKANLRLKQAGYNYYEAIKEQFKQWKLTKSECEVAMFLLKGLSFKEIASIRETQEKTVRQQATAIYSKAELKGRHEFAAYFFEDFLIMN
jgi:DNA-binding NarL/FixJ family response regulator